jgi:hypothetical protein
MKNKYKIRTASFESVSILCNELHQTNKKIHKENIEKTVSVFLLQNGDKAFCEIYNQAIADGKIKEVLSTLKLI